jgi:peroxiredoxin
VSRSLILPLFLVIFLSCKDGKQVNTTTFAMNAAEVSEPTSGKSDYEDLNGRPVALSDYKGKRIILSYWATWCRPCIAEMPSMIRAQTALGKDNYVMLLASDQPMHTIKDFQQKRGYDFTYLKFNGSLTEQQIYALPASFIYNSKGELQFKVTGAKEWDSPESLAELKRVP